MRKGREGGDAQGHGKGGGRGFRAPMLSLALEPDPRNREIAPSSEQSLPRASTALEPVFLSVAGNRMGRTDGGGRGRAHPGAVRAGDTVVRLRGGLLQVRDVSG